MVVLNNREQNVFDRVRPATLTFSPDSGRLGYVVRVAHGWSVVVTASGTRAMTGWAA